MFVINILCDMKRIVVASDSFKGSLTSLQVADAVESGIRKVYPVCEVVKVNVADGGEGTMDSLHQSLGGTKVKVPPLGRAVWKASLLRVFSLSLHPPCSWGAWFSKQTAAWK